MQQPCLTFNRCVYVCVGGLFLYNTSHLLLGDKAIFSLRGLSSPVCLQIGSLSLVNLETVFVVVVISVVFCLIFSFLPDRPPFRNVGEREASVV